MNTDQARTFLEVAATGNFIRAADRLNITQSTVSSRIKALEDSLGQRLFERDKAGARLTAAGRQFQRHAENMVRSWQQARHELALPTGFHGVLTLGIQSGLWHGVGLSWLSWLRRNVGELAVRAATGQAGNLTRQMIEGTMDLAILHDPQPRRGLEVMPYHDETLVLVSEKPRGLVRWDPHYVFVDWGDSFRDQHTRAYPVDETPSLTIADGLIGLTYILENGGSAYFPEAMVAPYIKNRTLFVVPDAPIFQRQLYLVYRAALAEQPWFAAASTIRPGDLKADQPQG